jgi:hypothetical protein
MSTRPSLAVLLVLTLATTASAQQSGSFLVRLGTDTTSIERYTRTGQRLEVEQVGRVPRVLHRRFTYELTPAGGTTRATATITQPGAAPGAPPFQQIDATLAGDSVAVVIRQDTTTRTLRVAAPAGTMIGSNAAPWGLFESQTMRLAKEKRDSLRVPLYQLGAGSMSSLSVRRLGRDSMVVQTLNDRYHARVDAQGRIQGVRFVSGTQGYNVARLAKVDLGATTSDWAAREKVSGAMGQLSSRDTTRATVADATLTIDYSRPAKRGRVIFGELVPYGQVWRTGANAATQLRTDKALRFGDVTVPAGSYSLFTIPGPNEWTLIVNSETGQPGTAHKPERDLFRIPMKVVALTEPVERFTIAVAPSDAGGALHLEWDTIRAAAPFSVEP